MPSKLNTLVYHRALGAAHSGSIDHGEWDAPDDYTRSNCLLDNGDGTFNYPVFTSGGRLSAKGVASALGRAETNGESAIIPALKAISTAIKARSGTQNLSAADDPTGHWVTIQGAHVFIGASGTVEKGPAHLIGKKPGEIGPQKNNLAPMKRVGTGKDSKLVHAESGEDAPEHIQKLKISPALKNVRANYDENGDLMAQGEDAKGRTQSVYSENHNMQAAAAKFSRVKELLSKQDDIESQNAANLSHPDENIRENAAVSRLIHQTGIRPGSDDDTGANVKAYGATTLEGRHVVVGDDGRVSLNFVGKKGVNLSIPVENQEVADDLVARAQAAGPGGKLFNTDDAALRDYTHTLDGGGFKTKDFRTALGTATAAQEVEKMPAPTTPQQYKTAVMKIAKTVSAKLGNTPSIALKAYIDPTVFSKWRMAA